jgi:hypothetical protein
MSTEADLPPHRHRIRNAKDTGLTNLPLHDFAQNEIWGALVTLACKPVAWTQMLALTGHEARRWEPKRLRLRLFSIAGTVATTGRRVWLHLSEYAPCSSLMLDAVTRLRGSSDLCVGVGSSVGAGAVGGEQDA